MSVAIHPADGLIVRGDSSIVPPLEPLLETSKTEPVTPAVLAPPELGQALTVLLQYVSYSFIVTYSDGRVAAL
jgi:hypothetical protein